MDKASQSQTTDSLVITGFGYEVSPDVREYLLGSRIETSDIRPAHDLSPTEFLRIKKTLKFMSKQDRLALAAAGKALKASGADQESLKLGCGVFMSVGYIPFRQDQADHLCGYARQDNRFSMKKFSTECLANINPLLTFYCLPNMAAHHLSANFDLQGEYFITYPGTPQMYLALREAGERLREKRMDMALVGGVADQSNFLVENHFRKMNPGEEVLLADAAAFILLEREEYATARGKKALARLCSIEISNPSPAPSPKRRGESSDFSPFPAREGGRGVRFGAADLPLQVCAFLETRQKTFEHVCQTEEGLFASRWEAL